MECVEVECGVCRWRSVCRVECVEMEGGMWECVEGGVWSVWRCVVSRRAGDVCCGTRHLPSCGKNKTLDTA